MDILATLPFCGAKATRTTVQSYTNNANTVASFTGTEFDAGGWYTGGNPTRLTVPVAADGRTILLLGSLDFVGNANGVRSCYIIKNNTDKATEQVFTPPGTSHAGFSIAATAVAVAGDYYELAGYQSSGGSLNSAVNQFITSMSIVVL